MNEVSNTFLQQISDLLHTAQNRINTAVNISMVYTHILQNRQNDIRGRTKITENIF
jgi:hypothetical protein